jgi:hypothetical protein
MKPRPELKMYAVVECYSFHNVLATMHFDIGKESNQGLEFLGFWTLSTVRCLKEHDVSETGSVSVLR